MLPRATDFAGAVKERGISIFLQSELGENITFSEICVKMYLKSDGNLRILSAWMPLVQSATLCAPTLFEIRVGAPLTKYSFTMFAPQGELADGMDDPL